MGVLRILKPIQVTTGKGKGKRKRMRVRAGICGTSWCAVENKYFVTADHIFHKEGKPRDPDDRFYVVCAPDNKEDLYWFDIIDFLIEDPITDYAVFEIADPTPSGIMFPALPLNVSDLDDGELVLTYGYPAPQVTNADIDISTLKLQSLATVLFSHANEGILSSQYKARNDNVWLEMN